jgi:hypothetical protein
MTDIEKDLTMDDLKTLISFTYPHEANMAKGFLESNGIESILMDEMTVSANNFYSNAIGGVKLLVKDSDYDNGIQLLKDSGYISDNTTKDSFAINLIKIDNAEDEKICPFCKSENIAKNKKIKISIWIIPVYAIIGTIFPFYRSSYKCFDCDKEWRFSKKK